MRLHPRQFPRTRIKGWRCQVCRNTVKENVGYRQVPLCYDCYNDPKMYQKFLKWLWVRNKKLYYKEIAKKHPPLKED